MLARSRFGRLLVGVARVPVFAFALVLLVGTVTISGANVLVREALRAWTKVRATPTGAQAPATRKLPSRGDGRLATAGRTEPAPPTGRNPRTSPKRRSWKFAYEVAKLWFTLALLLWD